MKTKGLTSNQGSILQRNAHKSAQMAQNCTLEAGLMRLATSATFNRSLRGVFHQPAKMGKLSYFFTFYMANWGNRGIIILIECPRVC